MVQVGEKRNLMKYFYPAIFTLDRKRMNSARCFLI